MSRPKLDILADVCTAELIGQNASTSGLQEQHAATSALHGQDTAVLKAQRKTKTNPEELDFNSDAAKRFICRRDNFSQTSIQLEEDIPLKPIKNREINQHVVNTSDELTKRFSYKCIYAPDVCSEVQKSYGSGDKAWEEIKRHVKKHLHLKGYTPKPTKRTNDVLGVDLLKPPPKRFRSSKLQKSVPKMEFNGDKSTLQQLPDKTDKEENVHVPLDTDHEANNSTDSNGILNTIKSGEFEHTYTKRPGNLSEAIPSDSENVQKKKRRQNIDLPDGTFDFNKRLKESSPLQRRLINTPPFPYVHVPFPLEAVQIVELDCNGDPVDVKEQDSNGDSVDVKEQDSNGDSVDVKEQAQPSTSRISSKKSVENKLNGKKSKLLPAVDSPRSVLECVENLIASKSNSSSEQKDALLPDDSIENSENVEKSHKRIALENIQILHQQRRKRKYRDKPTDYICKICEKRFTANTSLTSHYLGHLKIKPFKCNVCEREFTRRHSLKYHLMIHNKVTRFKCPTCERDFRHPSHYKDHLKKHTGEEPFSCKFCSNKFKTRNSFKRHLKMQHQKLLTSKGIEPIPNEPERN